jgi:magnesium-transporting ATPase (P-type)
VDRIQWIASDPGKWICQEALLLTRSPIHSAAVILPNSFASSLGRIEQATYARPAYNPPSKESKTMRALFKFLMGMVILAMVIGIIFYLMHIMSRGTTEELLDVVG